MLGPHNFAYQNRTDSPFSPKTNALKGADNKKLGEILTKPNETRAYGKPQNTGLKEPYTAKPIRQNTCSPPAKGGKQERDRYQSSCRGWADVPQPNKCCDDKGENHVVECIKHPATKGGKAGCLFRTRKSGQPRHTIFQFFLLFGIDYWNRLFGKKFVIAFRFAILMKTRRALQDFVPKCVGA
ncbi:hypothetical protein NBRC3222_1320 [Acetobacter pasteurianus NBRC 3222]|nr:hypothetical protein NBRC3222_1320 [Acetobacter pasteurianus NBRC 3222]